MLLVSIFVYPQKFLQRTVIDAQVEAACTKLFIDAHVATKRGRIFYAPA